MRTIFFFLIIGFFMLSMVSIPIALGIVDSPRKQMASGISAEDVVCKNELQLMLRNNGDAICVKPSSIERLVDRGIGEIIDTSDRDSKTNEESNAMDIDLTSENIIVHSEQAIYNLGSMMIFTGTAQPNQDLEVSLEDSNGNVVYADILEIDDSGQVYLEIVTDDSFGPGTYFLILQQSEDSEIVPVVIGESTGDIAVVIEKFHFDKNSKASIEVFGPSSAKTHLKILSSNSLIKFEDTINLDAAGRAEYLLDLTGYRTGVYSLTLNYGSEETVEKFTVGLSIRTTPIEITVDDTYYKLGETVTLTGESSDNTRILIKLIDPDGEVIDKIDYYTNDDGKFTYPLEISLGKKIGIWKIQVSNAERTSELTFEVIGDVPVLTIRIEEEGPFKYGDFVTISGAGMNPTSPSVIQIKSSDKLFELTPYVTNDGTFSEAWPIPDVPVGTYVVSVDVGTQQATTKLVIVDPAVLP